MSYVNKSLRINLVILLINALTFLISHQKKQLWPIKNYQIQENFRREFLLVHIAIRYEQIHPKYRKTSLSKRRK